MTKKSKRFKDFGSPVDTSDEPVTFGLYGEVFECYPEIQGVKLLEFTRDLTSGETSQVITTLLEFFENVCLPESYERLKEIVHSKDKIVKIETLTDIVNYVIEEYSERDPKE